VVDHSPPHRDGVPHHFPGNAELLQCMNTARRNREINRASADEISRARIRSTLIKGHLVSPSPEIRSEQPASQSTSDEDKFRCHPPEFLTTDHADITDNRPSSRAKSGNPVA